MTTGSQSFYGPLNPFLSEITCRAADAAGPALIDMDEAGALYLYDPAIARQLLAAAFDAIKILDPAGADAALSELLGESGLAKIRQRIREEALTQALDQAGDFEDTGLQDEPVLAPHVPAGNGPRCRAVGGDDEFICTAPPGHDGNHAAYGPGGELCATWPQDAPGRIDLGDDPDGDNSETWTCGSCGCLFAGDRPADGLCGGCQPKPVPSSGPLCAKCGSPGPLKTRANGMQVCEDTGACGQRRALQLAKDGAR